MVVGEAVSQLSDAIALAIENATPLRFGRVKVCCYNAMRAAGEGGMGGAGVMAAVPRRGEGGRVVVGAAVTRRRLPCAGGCREVVVEPKGAGSGARVTAGEAVWGAEVTGVVREEAIGVEGAVAARRGIGGGVSDFAEAGHTGRVAEIDRVNVSVAEGAPWFAGPQAPRL